MPAFSEALRLSSTTVADFLSQDEVLRSQPASSTVAPMDFLVGLGFLADPALYLGVLCGIDLALVVVGVLCCKGRLKWNPRQSRQSGFARSLSVSSFEGETWYECFEEGAVSVVQYPLTIAHHMSLRTPLLLEGAGSGAATPTARAISGARMRLRELVGESLPKLAPEERGELPAQGYHYPSWSFGDASNLHVRVGPSYPSTGNKKPSLAALYDVVGADIVSAGCRLEYPVPRLGRIPPGAHDWDPSTKVPRVIIINCQMPLQEGPKLFGDHPEDDAGTSIVVHCVATPELLRVAREEVAREARGEPRLDSEQEPTLPAVRLLQGLFERGKLALDGKVGFYSTGALKCIGWIEGIEDIDLPALLRPSIERYNGKPLLLPHYGDMKADPQGEWMAIDFDVRKCTWVSKSALVKLRDRFRYISVQAAFVIQGTKDEELPEVVLASLRIHSMDLENAAWIDDPNAPPGSMPPEQL